MASALDAPAADSGFDPQTGRLVEIAPGLARVTAPNAGPYTFTGTNSFLLGVDEIVVVDPGPADSRHFKALLAAIADRPVKAILLTHTHRDHCGLAARLRRHVGAPILSAGPHWLYRKANPLERLVASRSCDFDLEPDATLANGETLSVDGLIVTALATPGHAANHLAFSLGASPYLLTGDHVMGWSSTVVAPPDGDMGDYLASLERVIRAPFTHYLPAHGGPIAEGRKHARALLAHRLERNAQILQGLAAGDDSIGKLRARIYPRIAPALRPAAAKTIEAHLDYLAAQGQVEVARGVFGRRYRPA
jgi:glyoxylase-like metal-dependent hydrolase (beta-lactamase superfamily II)